MQTHAELSGSGAHRWMHCPGSVALSATYPRRSSSAAAEGTMAHALAEQVLRYHLKTKEQSRGLRARFRPGTTLKWEDHGQSLAGEVAQEMLDHVMAYVEYVIDRAAAERAKIQVEMHVDLDPLVKLPMWGTADCVRIAPGRLTVTDFKYGAGVPVHVQDDHGPNPQLLYYAVGVMLKLWDKYIDDETTVVIEVVQPRCAEVETVQTLELEAAAVMAWGRDVLWPAAHAVRPGAPLVPGNWCRFCPALADCPAVHAEAQALAPSDFAELAVSKVMPPVPDDPARLSKILRAAPLVDAWLRACEEAAHAELAAGREVPGFKLVAKRANRAWPTENPKDLADLLNAHLPRGKMLRSTDRLMAEPKLLSPAQLEKIMDKGIVNLVAVKPDGGTTVAAESDRRPAVVAATGFEELL